MQVAQLPRAQIAIRAIVMLHVYTAADQLLIRALTGAAVRQARLTRGVEVRTQAPHHILPQLRRQVGGDETETKNGQAARQICNVFAQTKVLADAHNLNDADEEHRQQ